MKNRFNTFFIRMIGSIGLLIAMRVAYLYPKWIRFTSLQYNGYMEAFMNVLSFLIFIVMILAWLSHVQNTIMHHKMKLNLTIVAGLMIFWVLIRNIKYQMLVEDTVFVRYFWYLFYIPMLFGPLLGYYTSLYIGQDDNYKINKKQYFFLGITIILFIGVLTNEFHHYVFIFDPLQFIVDGNYTYGFLYFCVVLWMIFLIVSMFLIIFNKCRILASRKSIWLPASLFVIAIIYAFLYAMNLSTKFIEVTTAYIWVYIMMWESLMVTGLVPTNIEHGVLFDSSTLSAKIVDDEYNVKHASKNAVNLSKEIMEESEFYPTMLDQRTRIQNEKINGGHILWLEDVSSINLMIAKEKKLREQLEENNDLLKAEIDLKDKQERIKVQNQLYDQISVELKDIIEKLDQALNEENPNLSFICFMGTYIKRMSNLIVLEQNNKTIQSRELDYCLKESLDVLRTNGTASSFVNKVSGTIEISLLKDIYSTFMNLAVGSFGSISSVLIQFIEKEDYELKVMFDGQLDEAQFEHCDFRQDGNTYYVTYHFKRGEIE